MTASPEISTADYLSQYRRELLEGGFSADMAEEVCRDLAQQLAANTRVKIRPQQQSHNAGCVMCGRTDRGLVWS